MIVGIIEMNLLKAGKNSKLRIVHSRLLSVLIFFLLMFCGNRLGEGLRRDLTSFAGLGCVIVASFGRVWSSIYIAGRKTSTLVEFGPYSVARNPLYLFSLVGAAGIGLASGSLLILALLTISFGLYYPFVILGEEESLRRVHGAHSTLTPNGCPGSSPKYRSTRNPTPCRSTPAN